MCKFEPGWSKSYDNSTRLYSFLPINGDGKWVSAEGCDAGTNVGCEPDNSRSLPCYSCSGGTPNSPDTCTNLCLNPISSTREGW